MYACFASAIVSLIAPMWLPLGPFVMVLSAVLPIVTWRWANKDVAKVQMGLMDPAGRGSALAAKEASKVSLGMCLFSAPAALVLWLLMRWI